MPSHLLLYVLLHVLLLVLHVHVLLLVPLQVLLHVPLPVLHAACCMHVLLRAQGVYPFANCWYNIQYSCDDGEYPK